MLVENQSNINSVIGSANYDVGHVFGTNSGGIAGFGVTCINNSKARGVTGSSAPIGDPFDVDYVAHEIGHQFGGSHSFNNSCGGNRSDAQAVEPGSGSTIMAYAGICNPNVQSNSDDHFHGINMRQIGIRISNDNCPVLTPLDNTMPAIGDLPAEIFIPVSTPFALTANALDLEGDALTWCWEQMDNEISTQPPVASASTGPSFRSFSPADMPTRYFPRLQTIAFNQPTTWEQLPSVTRQMTFRVSVRDNSPAGGCTQWADVEVNTNAIAGPFVVLYPSTSGITWQAFSFQTVTWDVANTTAAPINAELVDIYLSTNSGSSFPTLLAQGVPNTGSFTVQVPNIGTTQARVMVINSEGTFFDMSNSNFTITQITDGFAFQSDNLSDEACQSEDMVFNFEAMGIGSFAESIDLSISSQPPGATVTLSAESALPGEVIQVTVSNTENTPGGTYNLTITGNGTSFSNELTFVVGVINTTPIAAQPASPANGAGGINTNPTLSWVDSASLTETYTVQVATDAGFGNIIFEDTDLSTNEASLNGLINETTYYWRVFNISDCGSSASSEVYSFTTFQCIANAAASVPATIPGDVEASATSIITIAEDGTVGAVKVSNVQGEHANIADLIFTLTSPEGTSVTLASGSCGLGVTLFGNETIEVNNPAAVAGTYIASVPAGFGPGISSLGLSGIAVLADDGSADATFCDPAINAAALNGNIALVFRGSCNFATKVQNAQDAGAIAVIVINNQSPGVIPMGGTASGINIPAVMISNVDGTNLLNAQADNATNFNFSFDDAATSGNFVCPATGGITYQPDQALSAFVGEAAEGEWILEVLNLSGQAQGVLNNWTLELCYADGLTNTESAAETMANLYPNPTSGMLHIALSTGMKVERILVFDLTGRVVKLKNVVEGANIDLDMWELANGLYMVQLQGGGSTTSYRVVKGE
jgi:subtilisin-like proprotein convertase family protein